MRRLAKNLILTTAAVSAIFLVDLATAEAITQEKICPLTTDIRQQIDFWGKFRDTVMPKPDEPQNNNPPKEMKRPRPKSPPPPQNNPKPAN